jgi:hypothetical protein
VIPWIGSFLAMELMSFHRHLVVPFKTILIHVSRYNRQKRHIPSFSVDARRRSTILSDWIVQMEANTFIED